MTTSLSVTSTTREISPNSPHCRGPPTVQEKLTMHLIISLIASIILIARCVDCKTLYALYVKFNNNLKKIVLHIRFCHFNLSISQKNWQKATTGRHSHTITTVEINMAFTSAVPAQMSLMWSQMALAADMALDSFLALMTAAPLCCTVCNKITWTITWKHSWSQWDCEQKSRAYRVNLFLSCAAV